MEIVEIIILSTNTKNISRSTLLPNHINMKTGTFIPEEDSQSNISFNCLLYQLIPIVKHLPLSQQTTL